MKKALITGITGQDGSYLAELLLDLGYEVHGIVRHVALESPTTRLNRILHIKDKIHLHSGSLESYSSLFRVVQEVQPDECYHLAAQSFVGYSFEDEFSTIKINLDGTHHILSAIRTLCPECKIYYAATSEMFGNSEVVPQNEKTPFNPRSTYGISKLAGYHLTKNYREAYGMFACSGILFNHESERRGYEFVTRKISSGVARIYMQKQETITLGNLDAQRDWGYAGDYVEAMHQMLQYEKPDDYVIATNQTHSVQDFIAMAFDVIGISNWQQYVIQDEKFFRPSEVNVLLGDYTKANKVLGWKPKVEFDDLVSRMVLNDLKVEKGCR